MAEEEKKAMKKTRRQNMQSAGCSYSTEFVDTNTAFTISSPPQYLIDAILEAEKLKDYVSSPFPANENIEMQALYKLALTNKELAKFIKAFAKEKDTFGICLDRLVNGYEVNLEPGG